METWPDALVMARGVLRAVSVLPGRAHDDKGVSGVLGTTTTPTMTAASDGRGGGEVLDGAVTMK